MGEAPEVAQLRPGVYNGFDGQRYRVLCDGTTYREVYRMKRAWDAKKDEYVMRPCGPTLLRMGTTRLKVNASPPARDLNDTVQAQANGQPATGGAA